jgi:hypothetical protein
MVRCGKVVSLVLMIVLFFTSVTYAQWVFLGRKAVGKISHLADQFDNKSSEVATVLLEAKADNVYNTAVNILKGSQNAVMTRKDDASRTVYFTFGHNTASLKISSLQDNVSQLIISSSSTSGKPGDTSFVVDSILRVCREMGVECGLAEN